LHSIVNQRKVVFILNDRPDIAVACNADGVHLGQNDIPPKLARRLLGKNKIIGLSCHSLEQARRAQKDHDVDYISIGPAFPTVLKPKYKPLGLKTISKIRRQITKPFFIIGGIDLANMKSVLHTGATRVVLCRAICNSSSISKKTKLIKSMLQNN